MRKALVIWAAVGAGCAVAFALTPAISAVLSGEKVALPAKPSPNTLGSIGSFTSFKQGKVSLKLLGSIGSFTPVTRDERLARAYADAVRESQTRGFRFTPTSGGANGERSLTVLVRATSEDSALKHQQPPGLGGAPLANSPQVAFSLGKGKGLDRFSGDGAPTGANEQKPIVENVQMPKTNFALQPDRNRFSTNLQFEARDQTATAPTNSSPQTLGQEKSYGVDLSSSYSLSRHLDVQAGVRYRGPDNRLVPQLTDQAKDSQAVYVGTKFKF